MSGESAAVVSPRCVQGLATTRSAPLLQIVPPYDSVYDGQRESVVSGISGAVCRCSPSPGCYMLDVELAICQATMTCRRRRHVILFAQVDPESCGEHMALKVVSFT